MGKKRWQTIGDWESGAVNFNVADLVRLAQLYGVSTDWLFGLSEKPEVPPAHCVIDLEVERAILSAKSTKDLERIADDGGAMDLLSGGVLTVDMVEGHWSWKLMVTVDHPPDPNHRPTTSPRR